MNSKRLARIGLLIIFTIIALYWGINFLQGRDVLKQKNVFHARYQRIDGLIKSSPVMLNGYKVGQVSKVVFADDGSGDLVVSFRVPKDFKIPVNSVAKIISIDLMGTKSVSLVFSKEQLFHKDSDFLLSDVEGDLREQVSMQVAPLKNKAEQLMGSLDSALTVITYVFNERTRQNLSESFEHINNTIYNLEATSKDLQELIAVNKAIITSILANIDSVSGTLNTNKGNLDNIAKNLSAFSDTLSQIRLTPLVAKAQQSMDGLSEIVSTIKSGEGTLGKMVTSEALYNNLQRSSYDLDRLLQDIRLNPQRYVHFSAIDLGKDIYITSSGNSSKIMFKVLLVSSDIRIPPNSLLFEDFDVEEKKIVNTYFYLIGNTPNYNDALALQEKAGLKFPEAEVVAFKNGKKISLKKALRKAK